MQPIPLQQIRRVMRSTLLVLVVLCFGNSLYAQQRAITQTGETVILNDDGTWELVKRPKALSEIPIAEGDFVVPKGATFEVKSSKIDVSLFVNPDVWVFRKAESAVDAEYEFRHKTSEIYAMLITEPTMVPMANMKDLALRNAKAVSNDVEILREEMRNINGVELFSMELKTVINGKELVYYGFYYSTAKGTVQLIAYSEFDAYKKERTAMTKLLNGLVLTEL